VPIIRSIRQQPYPLISGVTGIQGEDTPETSGPWSFVCSVASYGEIFNPQYPYRTLWSAFAGLGHEFATADERPPCPWHIGAVLGAGIVTIDRLEFAHRQSSSAARITQCTAELATRSADNTLSWHVPAQDAQHDPEGVVIRIGFRKCAGARIRVDAISETGTHPGATEFQLFGFF
jgi:hypothetical protein